MLKDSKRLEDEYDYYKENLGNLAVMQRFAENDSDLSTMIIWRKIKINRKDRVVVESLDQMIVIKRNSIKKHIRRTRRLRS